MSKWKAIRLILLASNYLVITDNTSAGTISPLYAEKFREKLQAERDGLQLVQHRYRQMLNEIADNELGEL